MKIGKLTPWQNADFQSIFDRSGGSASAVTYGTRRSAIAERPRCRVP